MKPNKEQQKAIDQLIDKWPRKWTQLDIYGNEIDEVRDDEHQRCIYTDGLGGIVEILNNGEWANMIPQNYIPEDAPSPMFPDTDRNGVIGYMCQIDFECELGGASGGNTVYPSASGALCSASCGVVEVEVIGRKIIVAGNYDMDDEIEDNTTRDVVVAKLKKYDEGS
jgi:hypothetical protein